MFYFLKYLKSFFHKIVLNLTIALVFGFLFNITLASNNNKRDSLYEELNVSYNDTGRVNIFLELGYFYLDNQPDSALKYFDKATSLSKSLGSQKHIAHAMVANGKYDFDRSNFEAAKHQYFKGLKIFEELGDKHGRLYSKLDMK